GVRRRRCREFSCVHHLLGGVWWHRVLREAGAWARRMPGKPRGDQFGAGKPIDSQYWPASRDLGVSNGRDAASVVPRMGIGGGEAIHPPVQFLLDDRPSGLPKGQVVRVETYEHSGRVTVTAAECADDGAPHTPQQPPLEDPDLVAAILTGDPPNRPDGMKDKS